MAAAGPDVYLTFPRAFSPLPASIPPTVPPPLTEASLRAPFGINKELYNFALRPEIPITVAALYIAGVAFGNIYNRRRKHDPWPISRTDGFKYFVVLHNVLLALYSFATFVAMFRAITHTLPAWNEASGGLWRAKTADALCKLHGPRGLGDAASFNTTLNIWEAKNTLIKLGANGVPDPTDVGRLWNEGLAFWGWIFYVSKFYEVIDTLIILAKGKRSATLQTYHHAGAMLCMWAGIRYMSPPIWMFVFINSAIHAMMYTYFTCSALGIQVPTPLKRALTSLQISQFVFGASYAALHLFVKYDIPISTPFQVAHIVERAVSSASSAGTAATKSATSIASAASSFAENPYFPTAAASLAKKLLLRAAGDEGVAERIALEEQRSNLLPGQALPKIEDKIQEFVERRFETQWKHEWTTVNCIDTSGEAFAIYLNLLYLAPLTFLFARFFVRAYTARGKPRSVQQAARTVSEAARDAKNQTEYSVEKAGEKAEDSVEDQGQKLQEELKKDVEDFKNGVRSRRISDRIGESVKEYEEKVRDMVNGKSASASQPGSRKSSPSKQTSHASLRDSAVEEKSAEPEVKKEEASNNEPKIETAKDDAKKDDVSGGDETGDTSTSEAEKEGASGDAKEASPSSEAETTDDTPGESQPSSTLDANTSTPGDETYAEVVKKESNEPSTDEPSTDGPIDEPSTDEPSTDVPSTDEPTDEPADEPAEEDTDAMGKSGAIILTPDSPDASMKSEDQDSDTASTEPVAGGPENGLNHAQ